MAVRAADGDRPRAVQSAPPSGRFGEARATSNFIATILFNPFQRKKENAGRKNFRPALFDFAADYFLQHFAQPAASVQHFMHVAWSLQQLPSHFMAAGLEQEPSLQVAQPVNSRPAAQTAPSISIFILVFPFIVGWFVFRRCRPRSAWSNLSLPLGKAKQNQAVP